MPRQTIKLMTDYQCWPLWWYESDEPGNIDPNSLPISVKTVSRLKKWAEVFDAQLNLADPADSEWLEGKALADFEAEGIRLREQLQYELGELYDIVYFSQIERQVLPPPTAE